MKEWHDSQRGYFVGQLYEEMLEDENIYVLTGDLGYKMFDKIKDKFPKRFINCGASEAAMVGIAVGLAQEGKTVLVYTITSFFLRAAETISLYLSNEQCPVILVGGGRDDDYKEDGVSHHAYDAQKYLDGLDGLTTLYPETKEEGAEAVKQVLEISRGTPQVHVAPSPVFVSLRR